MKFYFLKTTSLLLGIFALLLNSCSSSDEVPTDPEIVFTSITANKTNAFIGDKIILTLVGTGYTDIAVTTANTSVVIAKAANGVYEISASKAASVTLYAELKNNSKKQQKTIDLNFVTHGINDFKTVEGITVDVDKTSKIVSLLGEPDNKIDSTDGLYSYWKYYSKGVSFTIVKSSLIATQIDIFSSGYYDYIGTTKIYYTTYPYEVGNGWKLNNTTMDVVVNLLGTPASVYVNNENTIRTYDYQSKKIAFTFFSTTDTGYQGKTFNRFAVY